MGSSPFGSGDGPGDRSVKGCDDSSFAARCTDTCSSPCSSGTSSTDGCMLSGTPPKACTSGSLGSRGCKSTSGSGSGLGFDSLGSFPSLIAFTIRTAFHFAYLIFACASCEGSPHMLSNSKNVAAARNVSAVCLSYMSPHLCLTQW